MLTNDDLQKIGEVVDLRLDKKLKPIIKELKWITNEMKVRTNYHDRRIIDHEKRLDRIDDHLDFPPLPPTLPSHV